MSRVLYEDAHVQCVSCLAGCVRRGDHLTALAQLWLSQESFCANCRWLVKPPRFRMQACWTRLVLKRDRNACLHG